MDTAVAHTTRPGDDLAAIERRLNDLERQLKAAADPDALNLIVFSGERDRLMAALVIATGAAACGMKVSMFFTFWATSALRSGTAQQPGKRLMERMFGWMLPNGIRRTKLSKMEMGGLGRWMMLREMKSHKMQDADELLGMAAELGVEIRVCEMSMRLMGIRSEELIEYPRMEFCSAASLAEQLSHANSSLFI